MAVNELWYDHDLNENMKVRTIPSSIFMDDDKANLVGVRVFNNGQPYQLDGFCTFNVLRADGSTVYGSGVIEDNKAYATLPAAAYRVPGRTVIFIRVRENDHTSVMLAISVITIRSRTDTIIDPEELIPSIEEILEEYGKMVIACDECDAASLEAHTAADLANEKAALAQSKAEIAQSKADLAQQKAEYADEKGQLAYEAATIASAASALAVRKAELADQKAALAQEKADLAQQRADEVVAAGQAATSAANLANEKAGLADQKATAANNAAALANEKAELANTKAGLADTAATNANEKASLANTKAELADQKAALAQEKADLANTKAELADEKATTANNAASAANTAAGRANAASEKLEGITADATTGTPSTPADADVTIVDGHYHLSIVVPKGDTGTNAAITNTTFQYQQSADGATVPTGTWSDARPSPTQGMYVWTKIHMVWNNGQETDIYTVGGRNGVDGLGSVVSVDGISPGPDGNVVLNLSQTYYTKNEVYSKQETYAKTEVYAKTETYTKQEVDQKIEDESFFFVNESGQLCQKVAETEEEQEG
ncbi:MAG: hypothetical protein IKH75_01185 [Ruminococcus sp.]|nr:hypothetical protein [Ruminococcus sp.]